MTDLRAIEKLVGETAREIGILVLVFAPLDAFFSGEAINIELIAVIETWAIAAIIGGIMLEVGD